ncbi:unnamed protein product, partial [Porites evermanni]
MAKSSSSLVRSQRKREGQKRSSSLPKFYCENNRIAAVVQIKPKAVPVFIEHQKAELEKELADRDGLSVAIESAITFINLFSAISGNVLDIKGTESSVYITEVSVLLSHLLNKDIKGTESSVYITEVSVLLSQLLNEDIKGTEPSVYITEVSVLLSQLLNEDVKETEPSVHIREVPVLQSSP